MTETKKGTGVRPGIPMTEEELKEWKKSFSDIEESINSLMEEDNGDNARPDSRPLCEESGEE